MLFICFHYTNYFVLLNENRETNNFSTNHILFSCLQQWHDFVESGVNLTGKSYAKLSGVNTTIELTDGESRVKQTGFVSILASNQVLPLHFPYFLSQFSIFQSVPPISPFPLHFPHFLISSPPPLHFPIFQSVLPSIFPFRFDFPIFSLINQMAYITLFIFIDSIKSIMSVEQTSLSRHLMRFDLLHTNQCQKIVK